MITNKYQPQQKHRLGTVSKTITGGLKPVLRDPNLALASIMAQNMQLFGPREGFLTPQWIITETNKSPLNTMMKQR